MSPAFIVSAFLSPILQIRKLLGWCQHWWNIYRVLYVERMFYKLKGILPVLGNYVCFSCALYVCCKIIQMEVGFLSWSRKSAWSTNKRLVLVHRTICKKYKAHRDKGKLQIRRLKKNTWEVWKYASSYSNAWQAHLKGTHWCFWVLLQVLKFTVTFNFAICISTFL